MKNAVILLFLFSIFFQFSCIPKCNTVTGPNDISYKEITTPSCCDRYEEFDIMINSNDDYKILCPDEDAPASWNFNNKTYIVITACNTAKPPYLAGVGNDPDNPNQIIVTIGLPCNYGAVPQVWVCQTFTLELPKTSKRLKVNIKKESY